MPICEICRSKLKDPRSKRHINSKKHQSALKKFLISFAIPERAKNIGPVIIPPPKSPVNVHIESLVLSDIEKN